MNFIFTTILIVLIAFDVRILEHEIGAVGAAVQHACVQDHH